MHVQTDKQSFTHEYKHKHEQTNAKTRARKRINSMPIHLCQHCLGWALLQDLFQVRAEAEGAPHLRQLVPEVLGGLHAGTQAVGSGDGAHATWFGELLQQSLRKGH